MAKGDFRRASGRVSRTRGIDLDVKVAVAQAHEAFVLLYGRAPHYANGVIISGGTTTNEVIIEISEEVM